MLKFNKNTEYHHCYHLLSGAYAGVIIFLKIIPPSDIRHSLNRWICKKWIRFSIPPWQLLTFTKIKDKLQVQGLMYCHYSMPSPVALDPIRVQSCVWCLFWTNRDCMAVTSIFLSISFPIRDMNSLINANCKWKYLLLLQL